MATQGIFLTNFGLLVLVFVAFKTETVAATLNPKFVEPIKNVTVEVGKNATFTCVVQQLQSYLVGWMKNDTRAIQAIGTYIITRNPRVSVSQDESQGQWMLHITRIELEDTGPYVCQVNTDPLMSQVGFLEVIIPSDKGQIKVDGEIEHGVWYKEDTVNFLGYAYDVAKDKPCCEECKNLYEDTEFFDIHRETGTDSFYKQCRCAKSKPGVVPSTYAMGSMSGKCGLWDYNGDGELGKDRIMVWKSTYFLGSTNDVLDVSYCCHTCMDKFPETQLFRFIEYGGPEVDYENERICQCYKTKTDVVPATWERVYGIGTCDGPTAVAIEIPGRGGHGGRGGNKGGRGGQDNRR